MILIYKIVNKIKFLLSYLIIPKNSSHEKIVVVNGYSLKVDISNDIGRKIFFTGFYEEPETCFCLKHLTPDDTIIDIGSNEGYYTVMFAKYLQHGNGKVYSFDPIPRNIEKIKLNLRLNGCEQNTLLYSCAVGLRKERLDFYVKHDTAYSSLAQNIASKLDEVIQVDVTTLDDIVIDNKLENVKILKIDTEGAEELILRGAVKSLSLQIYEYIIIELANEYLIQLGSCNKSIDLLLRSYGYKPYNVALNGMLLNNANPNRAHGNLIYAKH